MVRRHQHVEVDGHASAADDEGLSVSGFVANLAKETDFSEWSGADGEGHQRAAEVGSTGLILELGCRWLVKGCTGRTDTLIIVDLGIDYMDDKW